ncbi:MAG: hypothetical protein ACI30J_00670 [Paludibacteraceae bacterium]
MRIQPSSFFPICCSLVKQRYGILLLLCLLCTPAAAYTPTLPASSFRSSTSVGERLAGSQSSLGSSMSRIYTCSEMGRPSAVSAFQSTSVLLSLASSSAKSTSAVGASLSSGSSLGVSIPALPASGIVPSPAQMASTLAIGAASYSGNAENPDPDDEELNNGDPPNGAPVGDALLPLLLFAALYTLRLRKQISDKRLAYVGKKQ